MSPKVTSAERQSGHTSQQMVAAPRGAIYVWPVFATVSYAKHLARHLGRDDLRIEPASILDQCAYRLRGLSIPVVVDHATRLRGELYDQLLDHNARVARFTDGK